MLRVQFDTPLKVGLLNTDPRIVEKAVAVSLKHATQKGLNSPNSPAMMIAFGKTAKEGIYNISRGKARSKGRLKTRVVIKEQGSSYFLAQMVASGYAIGLHHFLAGRGWRKEKTTYGKSGTPVRRKVLRLRVKNRASLKPMFPSMKDGSMAKRWPHARPEFGGFLWMGGPNGKLVMRRHKAPRGHGDKKPIKSMYTLDPAHMLINRKTVEPIMDSVWNEFNPKLVERLDYYTSRGG